MSLNNRKDQRRRRHLRIRQRVNGTAARPRMAICISNKHLYVQFIDDGAARTLAATSSLQTEGVVGCNLASAQKVGENAARAALEKGIRSVVVDRGGFRYHGRVKQIVESAVAAGLNILNGAADAAEEAK
jgi:large subunit ribosomal protein L18